MAVVVRVAVEDALDADHERVLARLGGFAADDARCLAHLRCGDDGCGGRGQQQADEQRGAAIHDPCTPLSMVGTGAAAVRAGASIGKP
ncbi:hypothetical protein G6F40_017895 [Rhizopus arrhizus]|nr:hypothetical protein G6F40_017895 [Rhizopus arrhizus]